MVRHAAVQRHPPFHGQDFPLRAVARARYVGVLVAAQRPDAEPAPWQRREKVWHPELGEVIVKHGFADTQWLRTHSSWWPRDEPHFNREAGVSSHPLTINDESAKLIRHQLGSPRCA
ncbi:unnamed protein product [Prorocentrum cordatum]|uniref:Uncharacterized protein n=1 Tax=Prorocentrum cordatum TaxID=2364126 RepID=A0ABN9TW34_9DINO|nr:unnamed protein product [Polarella glacialis]